MKEYFTGPIKNPDNFRIILFLSSYSPQGESMSASCAAILIAEDDPSNGMYLKQLLEHEGYVTELAGNGKEALDMYRKKNHDVVISDLMMPEMNGEELLQELVVMQDPPVFLLETCSQDHDTIIKLIQKGASDYYIKPVVKEVFLPKVHKAIETSRLQKAQRRLIAQREHRLDQHLDWNTMKERVVARTYDKFDKLFFSSLKSALTQGAGIGSTVSLVSLIAKTRKEQGEVSLVRNDLLDMLFSNIEIAERALRLITEIHGLFEKNFDLQKVSLSSFYEMICDVPVRGKKYSALRSHQVYFNDADYRKYPGYVMIDSESMQRVFFELFLNACKFSASGSEIYIFTNCTKDHYFISFMNRPDSKILGSGSLKRGAENLIFEPFYRLGNYVFEEYDTIDFGLGLCFVEKVVRKNNGSIEFSQIFDESHFNNQPNNYRFCFEICLPVVQA